MGFFKAMNARNNAAQSASTNARQDGFTDDSPIFQFQRDIETSYNPNYPALRSVLASARNDSSVTLQTLHARYISETSK